MKSARIYTLGHSTRTFDELVSLLQKYQIELLIDVRHFPRSRTNPQFNKDVMPDSLSRFGIEYCHLSGLGGRRRPVKDSGNTAWRSASFQGYADYMQTSEFRENLKTVIELSRQKRLALMCAEAVPWRCHRSLIADALVAKKIAVVDIISVTSSRPHSLRDFASVSRGRIRYPKVADSA